MEDSGRTIDNKDLTKPTNSDIIDSWNRKKYPRFTDYLNSEDYKKWLESLE